MPRKPRTEVAGAIHHVTARSGSGRILFVDEADRRLYVNLFTKEAREREWCVLSYCQMTNHLHVLVRTPRPDLGSGFKAVHEAFAQHINRRHDEHGHAFGDRFYSRLVQDDRHFLGCLRYIARNPVEAAICRAAGDWAWSAHRALAGIAHPPPFLDVSAALGLIREDVASARVIYQRLVARSNAVLLAEMAGGPSDAWLIAAVDQFEISVREIAGFLGASLPTTYRRLAAAREAA